MLFYLAHNIPKMYEVLLHTLFIAAVTTNKNILNTLNFAPRNSQNVEKTLNLNETFFSSLENYQVNALPVDEKRYPWIARVIHSRSADVPHMCTAVCIDEAIFITASRCIYTLKVNYTTIIYMSKRLEVLAFVVPSEPTKQAFDDIGFIVVNSKSFKGMWAVIELFDGTNRTDNVFKWFSELDLSYGTISYKVVGYAMKKGIHKIKTIEREYNLTELNVVANMELCPSILTVYGSIKGFNVPCYHSCTFQQFQKDVDKCYNYHGVEGGAVFDTLSNKLMGIATWGSYFTKYELPVGFSIVNSENFFKDFTCARRIRDDNGVLITKGYYQSLCDGT